MDTKQALSMPVVIGIIAIVVIIIGVVGYKMLFTPAESGHAVAPASYGKGGSYSPAPAAPAKP